MIKVRKKEPSNPKPWNEKTLPEAYSVLKTLLVTKPLTENPKTGPRKKFQLKWIPIGIDKFIFERYNKVNRIPANMRFINPTVFRDELKTCIKAKINEELKIAKSLLMLEKRL